MPKTKKSASKKKPTPRKPKTGPKTKPKAKAKLTSAEKRELISRMLLKTMGSKVWRWGDLVDAVAAKLPKFEGSVPHLSIPCLRELEKQGRVKRELGPPVLYSKVRSR